MAASMAGDEDTEGACMTTRADLDLAARIADIWLEPPPADYYSPDGTFEAHHIDGVTWFDAPRPHRWHRCKVQTWGVENGQRYDRCACGAIRAVGGTGWFERNTRRRRKRGFA